jgi:hypothetical protein
MLYQEKTATIQYYIILFATDHINGDHWVTSAASIGRELAVYDSRFKSGELSLSFDTSAGVSLPIFGHPCRS